MRAFSPKRLRCSLKQCWFVNDCRRVRAAALAREHRSGHLPAISAGGAGGVSDILQIGKECALLNPVSPMRKVNLGAGFPIQFSTASSGRRRN
jgi:hypothetical protein